MVNLQTPSHGQKVDLGQDAPTKTEGAGVVPNESLAAESQKEGGEFASNKGIHNENVSSSSSSKPSENTTQSSSETTSSGSAASRSGAQPDSLAGEAPSYVNAQYIKESGPHGSNIKEVVGEMKGEDGIQKAFDAEIGGKNDPSRRAELQMEQNNNAMGRGAGPKEGELATETKFDALSAEKTA